MLKEYVIPESYWAIIHAMLSDSETQDTANKACSWITQNITRLKSSLVDEELNLFGIVYNLYTINDQAPSLELVKHYLDHEYESETKAELKDIVSEYEERRPDIKNFVTEADLSSLLHLKAQDKRVFDFDEILSGTRLIAKHGVPLKSRSKGTTRTAKGVNDAIEYLTRNLSKLSDIEDDVKSSGDIDEEFLYDTYVKDGIVSSNIRCGIDKVDAGITFKRGQFNGVLGFTGQRKSGFCRTWAYNALLQGFNVYHVALEMSYVEECASYLIVHSKHPKFGNRFPDISLNRYQNNELTKDEEFFLFKTVLHDFKSNVPGKLFIDQPKSSSWESIKANIKAKDIETSIDMLVIDYLTMCDVDKNNSTEEMTNIIRDAKRMAREFRDGKGLLVVTPVQSNREGYDRVCKQKGEGRGQWDARAVDTYSELYKSADNVLTVFLDDDLIADNKIIISSVKVRRGKPIRPFEAKITDDGFISDRKTYVEDKPISDIIDDL